MDKIVLVTITRTQKEISNNFDSRIIKLYLAIEKISQMCRVQKKRSHEIYSALLTKLTGFAKFLFPSLRSDRTNTIHKIVSQRSAFLSDRLKCQSRTTEKMSVPFQSLP